MAAKAVNKKDAGAGKGRSGPGALRKRVKDAVERLESEGMGLEELAVEEPKWFYEKILKPMLPKDDQDVSEERGRILVIDMTGQAKTNTGGDQDAAPQNGKGEA